MISSRPYINPLTSDFWPSDSNSNQARNGWFCAIPIAVIVGRYRKSAPVICIVTLWFWIHYVKSQDISRLSRLYATGRPTSHRPGICWWRPWTTRALQVDSLRNWATGDLFTAVKRRQNSYMFWISLDIIQPCGCELCKFHPTFSWSISWSLSHWVILTFSGGRMRSLFLAMKNLCIGCLDAFSGAKHRFQ